MSFSISPAVTVKEIDVSTVVSAVSETVAAIGGVFSWGPINDRTLISNGDELVSKFGKPTDSNFETFFTAANYLDYGAALYVSRAADANSFNSAVGNGTIANTQIKNITDFETQESTLNANAYYFAKYAGALGNSLKISVCDSANAYSSNLTTSNVTNYNVVFSFVTGSNVATLTVTDIATSNTTLSNTATDAVLAKLTVGDYLVAGNTSIGTQAVKISALGNTSSSANGISTATISLSNRYSLASNISMQSVKRYWEFYNSVNGAPGTSNYVSSKGGAGDELHIVITDEDGKITGTAGNVLEVFEGVSRATDALSDQGGSLYYKNVIKTGSAYVWAANDRAGSTSNTASQITAVNTLPYTASFTGGTDSLDESNITLLSLANAYNQFKSPEDVDVSIIIGGKAQGGAQGEGLANYIIDNILEVRKDCVGVFSPNRSAVVGNVLNPEEVAVTFRNLLPSTSYGILDSGYKYQYDVYNDKYRWVPLCGDTAGTLARTDNDRDPWWSPAGFNRGQIKNVTKLAWNPDKTKRDFIYKSNINPVVTFPGEGTVLYGDKTLQTKTSAFDRINVRRLFIVMEKAIATAAKYSLFEFNDEFTRASFKNMIEPYLRDIKGRRGIYDFKVVCDETVNTAEVIDNNAFVAYIYVKPAKSINNIVLTFVATRTGIDFDEIVGQVG